MCFQLENSLAVRDSIRIGQSLSVLVDDMSLSFAAIAALFTIFSSFVFGTTVVNLIDSKVSGLQ